MDADLYAAQQTLGRMDAHHRFIKRLTIAGVAAAVLVISVTCGIILHNMKIKNQFVRIQELADRTRVELQQEHADFKLRLASDATLAQMGIIDTILKNMKEVRKDSLWISKYEFRVGEWHGIYGIPYDEATKFYPMTNISYGEIYMFLQKLRELSGLDVEKTFKFDLPTADEWEYAARGGSHNESTLYVGSNNVDDVAWYAGNSGGVLHNSDGLQSKWPNRLDLFDMSGNAAEICNAAFEVKDEGARWTVCGGSFKSSADQVTVVSRMPVDINAKDQTIGFRLVVRRE